MQQLSPAQALAFATAQAASGTPAVFLDVREAWEIGLARIDAPAAAMVAIPMQSIPERLGELDPAQPVVCICHHGARSAQVVAFLERAGFTAAYNLAGGIDAWSASVDPAVPRY